MPQETIDPLTMVILLVLILAGLTRVYWASIKEFYHHYLGFKNRQDKSNDSDV